MKKKTARMILICSMLTALALALTLTAAASQGLGAGAEAGTGAEVRTAAVMMVPQTEGVHVKYMNGDNRGMFLPEQALTRAELAQMLCDLTADRPATQPFFFDVDQNAWYAQAVGTVAGLGLMTDDYGAFRPGDPATRAECAYALSMLLPYDTPAVDSFIDMWPGHWAYQAVCRVTGRGLFQGDGTGRFRPNDILRRCEAAAVFNRLLERSPDRAALAQRTDLRTFPDVPATHWAYGEIMEAAVIHQYAADGAGGEIWLSAVAESGSTQGPDAAVITPPPPATDAAGLPDGPQRINGHLCWVVDGVFARECAMYGLYFDENGWYTTGDAELDGMLNALVDELTDESMTRDQKLRALFNHVVGNYKYLARPLVSKGTTGWEPEYAKFFLKNGKGNCFSFAAAYCLLCRELGLPAYTVVGTSGGSAHGWVEIYLDGNTYMFDPELQWYYNVRTTKKVDLFKMLPSKVPAGVYRYAW